MHICIVCSLGANAASFLERVNRMLEMGGGVEADSLIMDSQGVDEGAHS